MAREAGLPIVPVWIEGNGDLRIWPSRRPPRVRVRVGEPIRVDPATAPAQVIARLEEALDRLAAQAGT